MTRGVDAGGRAVVVDASLVVRLDHTAGTRAYGQINIGTASGDCSGFATLTEVPSTHATRPGVPVHEGHAGSSTSTRPARGLVRHRTHGKRRGPQ
jgi:hypothetical protein